MINNGRDDKSLVDIIRNRRKELNITQEELGKVMGVSKFAVSKYENGDRPFPRETLPEVAAFLDLDYFHLTGKTPVKGTSSTMLLIGKVVAGSPLETYPDPVPFEVPLTIKEEHPNGFLLEVTGDSMDQLFPDGQLVLVDPQKEVRTKDVAAVRINGTETTVKRVYLMDRGIVLEPVSNNDKYRSIMITNPEDLAEIHIEGKVVWDMANPNKKKY